MTEKQLIVNETKLSPGQRLAEVYGLGRIAGLVIELDRIKSKEDRVTAFEEYVKFLV